jgi:hypothetical protein
LRKEGAKKGKGIGKSGDQVVGIRRAGDGGTKLKIWGGICDPPGIFDI